ncbi:hypothetical protein, partial [Bradyrhizobium arachidis]|uniref:hypothetical protein n=1 Tax=Bradyrhizobium arachidis TaxID=858423 RepID=UPI001ABF514F
SKQRPDTLMQDRIYRIVEIFLHPTAGPYIWVTSRPKAADLTTSAFTLEADVCRDSLERLAQRRISRPKS